MSSKALKLDINRRDDEHVKIIDLSSLIDGLVNDEKEYPKTKKYKPGELKLAIWESVHKPKKVQTTMRYSEIFESINQIVEQNYFEADQLFKDLLKMKCDSLEAELCESVGEVLGQIKRILKLNEEFINFFERLRPLFTPLETKFAYCESKVNYLEKLTNRCFINFFCSPPVQDRLKIIYSYPMPSGPWKKTEKDLSEDIKVWLDCIEMDLKYSNLIHFDDIKARFVDNIEAQRDQFIDQAQFWTDFFLSVNHYDKKLIAFYESFKNSHFLGKIKDIFIRKFFTDQGNPESKLWHKNFLFDTEGKEFSAAIKKISGSINEPKYINSKWYPESEETILKYFSKSVNVVMTDLEKDLNKNSKMKEYVTWILNWITKFNYICKLTPNQPKYKEAMTIACMTPLMENKMLVSKIGANFCSDIIKGRIKVAEYLDILGCYKYFAPNEKAFCEELCRQFERRIEKNFVDGTDYDKLIVEPFESEIQKNIESRKLSSHYLNLKEAVDAGKRYNDRFYRILLLNQVIWKYKNDNFKFPEEMLKKISGIFENFTRYNSHPLAMHGSVEFMVDYPKTKSYVFIKCLPIHAALLMYVIQPMTIDDLSGKTNMSGEDLLPHLRMLCNKSIVSTSLNENDLTLYFLNPYFNPKDRMIDFFKK